MNSRERVFSALEYKGFDRPPTHHYGTPEINKELMDFLGVSDYEEMALILGDDLRHIEPEYIGPELRTFEDGTWEGIWGERYMNYCFGEGTYPEVAYMPYAEVEEVDELKDFRFPTADWFDYSTVKERAASIHERGFVAYIGDAGVPDFLNGIARCRGVEQVLIDVGMEDPVFLELMEKRVEFFYGKLKRTLEAADGLIDIVAFGEDLGTQNGLTINPKSYDKLFAHHMERFFKLAHDFGARTMMHSCGSVRDMIPRLIDLGLDIQEVVQVDAAKMDIRELHRDFYGKVAFCGSISVQNTLPRGTEEEVRQEVRLR
ncbi:MAG: hypothetical protein JJU11_14130, partial [Candidatus Sumerlaeia bacterium]|nr:hypothetical protein [Candidatus Sumerlaeia bacterium]